MTTDTPLDIARAPFAVHSTSVDQTRAFAAALAEAARPGDRIALIGELGAGKTQFAKGFASGLGVTEVVNSPSFTLMAEYAGRLPLFHQDLYRLLDAEEVLGGGMVDERQEDGVTLSEWAERLPEQIDARRLTVRFEVVSEDERRISIIPAAADHGRYLAAARHWATGRAGSGR